MINITEIIVMLLYFIVVIIIGILASRRVVDSDSYYLADRQLGPILAGLGRFAAVSSSFTYLGALGLGYQFGFPILISVGAGLNIGFLLSLLVLANMRNSDAVSIADFLAKRFDSKTLGLIASILAILIMVPSMIAQVKGAGLVGNSILGVPEGLAMVISVIIFLFYVFAGGLWAVTWTDVLQGIMLAVFMIIPTVLLINNFGAELSTLALENAPHFIAGNLPMASNLGMAVTFMASMMVFPAFLFWSFTTKNANVLRQSIGVTTFMGLLVYSTFFFVLAGAFAVAPNLGNPDNAYLAVANFLFEGQPILLGIIGVATLSAVMSSTDALLLATSSIVSNDIWKFIKPNTSNKNLLVVGRIATVAIAATALLFSFNTPSLIGELMAASAGSAGSAFLFPIVLGVWWKRMNAPGAIAGSIVGYVTYNALTFGSELAVNTPILYALPLSGLVCIIVTLFTAPPNQKQIEFYNKLHDKNFKDEDSKSIDAS